jgi:SAM-dependent methyltransferase
MSLSGDYVMDDQPKPVFIDETLEIYEEDEALSRLKEKNDLGNADSERGITRVELSRWEEAQRYERRTWLLTGRSATDDRNTYHKNHFANYAVLHGHQFSRGIELGCGPFTNMRLILSECTVADIALLDPLIPEYLGHPFCTYKAGRIGGLLKQAASWQGMIFPKSYLRSCLTACRCGGLFGRPVQLITSMIETYQTNLRFDLVVMVNVLEHCQDADRVFGKILELLCPGGILVYADVVYDAADVLTLSSTLYDAGHPLRVDRSVVDQFLDKQFVSLMRAEYLRETSFRNIQLQNYELYFVGKRL